ncbi:MAG TPA: nitrous oxide reductase accessory protein NosL [Candidatus Competibacteraceae bacterium]|nr:MAG: twin-arginine translocation pathway signal protein [Candidatus Competibacteraceae bacterium]HNW79075.1 nitrous oxide reductase accessory protein NosL [Candidatus Competibacteraceae bacterium]HQC71391.1 nitrous oxide reductase accessory protein NosL [Candidatus Competibacteraceae bacterium]
MTDPVQPTRRQMLRLFAVTGATAGIAALSVPSIASTPCATDGTPLQFVPKTQPDPKPLDNELVRYPKCPYCGMDRTQYHHSRHLVQYQDDLIDATCSLHCAALSLALNLDRGPKAIYAADFGAKTDPKPLVNVDDATYLIGSKLPGVMTQQSKVAFADKTAAEAVQKEQGGELGDFDTALQAAYQSMASDTAMIRKKRADKKQHAAHG